MPKRPELRRRWGALCACALLAACTSPRGPAPDASDPGAPSAAAPGTAAPGTAAPGAAASSAADGPTTAGTDGEIELPADLPGGPYTFSALEHAVARVAATPLRDPAPSDAAALRAWQPVAAERLASSLGVRHLTASAFPLELAVLDVQRDGRAQRYTLSWLLEPGLRTIGYLFVPDDARPDTALVFWHGHSFGGARGPAGIGEWADDEHHAGARALAAQGFVVLAPTIRTLEPGAAQTDHYYFPSYATLRGTTALGLFVSDARRALDVLEALPDAAVGVDAVPAHIGVTGLSLGGFLTLFSAALDPRVDAAVVQGFLGSYRDSMLFERQCGCQYAGDVGSAYDIADIAAIAAPTPIRFIAGERDRDLPFAQQRAAFDTLHARWAALGAGEEADFVAHPGGHEWVLAPAADWLSSKLTAP